MWLGGGVGVFLRSLRLGDLRLVVFVFFVKFGELPRLRCFEGIMRLIWVDVENVENYRVFCGVIAESFGGFLYDLR